MGLFEVEIGNAQNKYWWGFAQSSNGPLDYEDYFIDYIKLLLLLYYCIKTDMNHRTETKS